jgi:two-component system chemotaxis response regulator CheB
MNQETIPSSIRKDVEKIRVFIVDDSPLMCRVIGHILAEDPDLKVVGHALNGQDALKALSQTICDVCTLDVHMPGMNGLSVLKHIMIRFPIPTLMISAFTADGSRVTFEALRYGAVDFFQKPAQDSGQDLEAQKTLLQARVKRAARVQAGAARYLRLKQLDGVSSVRRDTSNGGFPGGITVIGASTGGYAALLYLIPIMSSAPASPVIVALGTPPQHLKAFVDYLQAYVPMRVMRASEGEILKKGTVYFISCEESSSIERNDDSLVLRLGHRPDLSSQEGSLDLLLYSASEHFGSGTLSVFLSGDGTEGLGGAKEVSRVGGTLLVQRPDTCLAPEIPDNVEAATKAETRTIHELAAMIQGWNG